MDRGEIEKILREILCKRVPGLKPETLTPEIELAKLGVDSLAFSWIIADMEDAFDFVMKGADILKLKTLAESVALVENRLKA